MKVGIIREDKNPPDRRVPLSPEQCRQIIDTYSLELVVQSSSQRCFTDDEYRAQSINVVESVNNCDILLGVKEVPISNLIENKTYFFFSHTIKAQAYNRALLQSILKKRIRLIDWETLTNQSGQRLIAFGRFAGMVGAHNAIWTYGKRTQTFDIKRMVDCRDYAEAKSIYKALTLPPIRIVLTGTGRVASGSAEVLLDMGIKKVSPESFLEGEYNEPVFTQLGVNDYVKRNDGQPFTNEDFFNHPDEFEENFKPYTKTASIFINGIYWDNEAPAFFTIDQMKSDDFSIEVIADVTCDIAPVSSVPSTIRPSTIDNPVYGFDPYKSEETEPFKANVIDVMAIDNLPNELPRDASESFGQQFIHSILPELLDEEQSTVINNATITKNGQLTSNFKYLQSFVNDKKEIDL